MSPQASRVVVALRGHRYRYRTEVDLHEALAVRLDEEGIVYEREVRIAGGRIDFLLPWKDMGLRRGLGVEVKVKGGAEALRRQMLGYAAEPTVDEFLVVTTRPTHRAVSGMVGDKGLYVLTIGGLSL